MFEIPTSALSDLIGISEREIRTAYGDKLTGADKDLLPISILPYNQIELCLEKYFFHERYLNIDLFRLAAGDVSDFDHPFPLLNRRRIQNFFNETEMLRQANRTALTYSGERTVTLYLARIASEYGVSYRTLMRRRRLFMNQSNLRMLLDADHNAYLYHDHLTSMCLYACDYAIYRHLAVNSPSANKILREFQAMKPLPCSSCPYSKEWQKKQKEKSTSKKHPASSDIPPFTCKRNATHMIVPKTRYPLNDLFATVSAQDVCLARKGVDAWADKYHYTPTRKKPERINEVWFSDHHPLDLFVITQRYKDGTFDTARVWLTAVMDAASNAMVGYTLTTRPNTASIAEAFARAAVFTTDSPFYALPEIFYIDNGKDYRSKLLNGKQERKSNASKNAAKWSAQDEDFATSGMMEWLGIQVTHALPYRGCSKTIERIFGTIEREWISDLPGWCGNNVQTRPITFESDLKKGRLYTFEQFASYFADTIWHEYNSFKSTPDKESPLELYERLPRVSTFVPSWRTMAVLKSERKPRIVQQSGIRFNNHWYWHPALAPYIGESVQIFTFDTPFHRSISVTANRTFIAEAHPVDGLALIEEERYRIYQHLAEQGRQRRIISNRLEELRTLVLKSDILDRGVNIPPIEEFSYAQAVDEERNKDSAVDDKRVPEELKEAAVKFSAQNATGASSSDTKPMKDFMKAIGSYLMQKSTQDAE
ncbi:MAG: Mu transposase C-terminal domain-containing protein [Lachnospiraceae bacterium]|nr:Mu transposase C-terminal domain-containing protein [Lachnospiraceae bacterium]